MIALKVPAAVGRLVGSNKKLDAAAKSLFYRPIYEKLLAENKDFRLVEFSGQRVTLEHVPTKQMLSLTPGYGRMLLAEWAVWQNTYLPKFSLEGKTVLDIGAGCGETAFFYLLAGAKKVICVEINAELIPFLAENKQRGLNMEVVSKPFELSLLSENKIDFMKCDCEGCEKIFLQCSSIPPCVMETHNSAITQELMARFNLALLHKMSDAVSIVAG